MLHCSPMTKKKEKLALYKAERIENPHLAALEKKAAYSIKHDNTPHTRNPPLLH